MLFLVLVVVLAIAAAIYTVHHYNYWQRRGFPYDVGSGIPFGCLDTVVKHKNSMGMAIYDMYLKSKEPFLGVYLLFRPAVLVRDVELTRRVLAQDFASFHDRGVYVDEKKDPLSGNLFSLEGQSWRSMRVKLAPSFTSGKLRAMFGTSEDIGNKMVEHIKTLLPERGSAEIEIKHITANYAIDIIASVIFGLEINSFENPTNKFRSLIKELHKNTHFTAVFGMLVFLCPSLAKILLMLGFKNKVACGLRDIMKDTIEYREKHNIVRRDMLQLLMQLRNTGEINEDDSNWAAQNTTGVKAMSIDKIAAQGFIFYVAGQETTASTAAFTIFELAQNPDLLHRAQQEVQDTLDNNGGKIDYESLKKMEFLENCIQETIRKYPGLPLLNRECTQTYQIPGTDKVIEKGTPVIISLFGIHRDPLNFPNPDKYDPDRFLKSSPNYNQNAYMPFGEGPRHCIAQRMGVVNSKLAVFKILQSFNVEIMEKREIEIDNFAIAIMPKGGVKVRLSNKPTSA